MVLAYRWCPIVLEERQPVGTIVSSTCCTDACRGMMGEVRAFQFHSIGEAALLCFIHILPTSCSHFGGEKKNVLKAMLFLRRNGGGQQ